MFNSFAKAVEECELLGTSNSIISGSIVELLVIIEGKAGNIAFILEIGLTCYPGSLVWFLSCLYFIKVNHFMVRWDGPMKRLNQHPNKIIQSDNESSVGNTLSIWMILGRVYIKFEITWFSSISRMQPYNRQGIADLPFQSSPLYFKMSMIVWSCI